MLTILQKIKELVYTQTVKLAQYEAKDGSVLDIDKLGAGGLINVVSELKNIPANGEYIVENEGISYKIVAKEGVIDSIVEAPVAEPVEPATDVDVIPVEAVEAPVAEPVEESITEEEVKPNDLEAKVNNLEEKVNELAEIIFELIKKMNGEELKSEIKTEMKIEKLSKVSEIKENKKYTGTDSILYHMYK